MRGRTGAWLVLLVALALAYAAFGHWLTTARGRESLGALAAYLAGIADRHATVTDVETQVVDRESIPDAIVEGLGPGTLVCMSSHGRGGLTRVVMGSVAEAL